MTLERELLEAPYPAKVKPWTFPMLRAFHPAVVGISHREAHPGSVRLYEGVGTKR